MRTPAELPTEAEVVADLKHIRTRDWSKPHDLASLRALYDLLPHSRPPRTDAAAIRDALHALLGDMVVEIEAEERADPPELDRSFGHAGRQLLKLSLSVGNPPVDDLYDAVVAKWKVVKDRRSGETGPMERGTFTTSWMPRVYDELGRRLLRAAAHTAAGSAGSRESSAEHAVQSHDADHETDPSPEAQDSAAVVMEIGRLAQSGHDLHAAGDYEAALLARRRVVALRTELYGAEHEQTMSGVHQTIYTLVELQRFSEALPLCQRLVAGRERTLGGEDRRTRDSLVWLEFVSRKAHHQ